MREQCLFCMMRDFVEILGDGFCWIRATPDFNQLGVVHELAGQSFDFTRECGGEKQGLTLTGKESNDFADGWDESHIEHSIGFI